MGAITSFSYKKLLNYLRKSKFWNQFNTIKKKQKNCMSRKHSSVISNLYLNSKQIHKFTGKGSLLDVNLNLGKLASNFDDDNQKLVP